MSVGKSYPTSEWLRDLVIENSVGGPTRTCCDKIKGWLLEAGVPENLICVKEYEDSKAVLVANTSASEERDVIVLTGHLDTVPLGDESQWKYPPLSAQIEDGVMYGRGTVDMKSGCVACIAAFIECFRMQNAGQALPFDIRLVLTTEEEIGMFGAKHLVKEMNCMNNVKAVLVAEPTSLEVGIAEKGVLWVELKVHGKPAHAAYGEQGLNAIEEMARITPQMRALIPQDTDDLVGRTSLNLGVVQGGTQFNVVAEWCTLCLDYRVSPNSKMDDFEKHVHKTIADLNANNSGYQYLSKTVHKLYPVKSEDTKFTDAFVQSVNAVKPANDGTERKAFGLRFATDAAIFCPLPEGASVPMVICGPGPMELCHVANERVNLKEVETCVDVIVNSLKTYASS